MRMYNLMVFWFKEYTGNILCLPYLLDERNIKRISPSWLFVM